MLHKILTVVTWQNKCRVQFPTISRNDNMPVIIAVFWTKLLAIMVMYKTTIVVYRRGYLIYCDVIFFHLSNVFLSLWTFTLLILILNLQPIFYSSTYAKIEDNLHANWDQHVGMRACCSIIFDTYTSPAFVSPFQLVSEFQTRWRISRNSIGWHLNH